MEDLRKIAEDRIESLYGWKGFDRTWYLNADGDLQLDFDEDGEIIER
ncbi:MAG: hypothetical protein LIO63_08650 [Akkermansia sp.]|nr:hypothetical protein [Akkermansia sp.]